MQKLLLLMFKANSIFANCKLCEHKSLIINIRRPNNNLIMVAKKSKLHARIGDVVTVADVASQKMQSKHVHKVICVRPDLKWTDVVGNYLTNKIVGI